MKALRRGLNLEKKHPLPIDLSTENIIISVMAAWPIKFTEGSKSGKKHPLPIDLSTENKKAKRSAYEKERRPGRVL
jgi:hypothetical protein